MKVERNIIAPFYVFFIIMGIGGVIVLPIAKSLFGINEENYKRLFDLCWEAGALIALLYSLIILKDFLRKSFAEKILYFFLAIVFIGLLVFPLVTK